jgi:glycosyltransferase involved in cell wall biosynthesis
MTDTARQRLVAGFGVDDDKVIVIPHGAATPPVTTSSIAAKDGNIRPDHHPRLLTWGLLGPGKGVEWAIDAFAELDDLDPAPTYVIAGATHPKVRERSGESYREMLGRAGGSGCSDFDDSYRDLESLTELIRSTDRGFAVRLSDQVTSGCSWTPSRPGAVSCVPHAVELRHRCRNRRSTRSAALGCDPLGAD